MTHLTMSRALLFVLAIALLLTGVYAYVSYAMASSVTTPDRSVADQYPEQFGLHYEEVTFPPRGDKWADVALRGWLIGEGVPADHGDRFTVLLVHGLNSNRAGDNALALADRLYDLGYSVLLFELRGHGESDGDQVAAGYLERWDVLGAYDFLVERGVPPERIGVLGNSMGGATALLAVAEEPGIGALVVDSAFADLRDMIAQETARTTVFPEWMVPLFIPGMSLLSSLLYGIDIGAVVPERAAATLDYPILIIHGDADTRIPVGQGVRIHASSPAGSEVWLVPGSDHVDSFLDSPDEYVRRIDAYFRSQLQRHVAGLATSASSLGRAIRFPRTCLGGTTPPCWSRRVDCRKHPKRAQGRSTC